MVNPLVGHIAWPVPDNHTISVTLFKDSRTHELEDKEWTFVIEDVSYFEFLTLFLAQKETTITYFRNEFK